MNDNDIDNAVEVISESIWETLTRYKASDDEALQVLKRVLENINETKTLLEEHIYEEDKMQIHER